MRHHLFTQISGPFRRRLVVYGALGLLALGGAGVYAAETGFQQLSQAAETYISENHVPVADHNAIEHCLGSAILTERYGENVAIFLGNLREDTARKYDPPDRYKDQWNNAIGRGIAVFAKKTGLPRDALILDAYQNGMLIVRENEDPRVPKKIAGDPHPQYSGPSVNFNTAPKKPALEQRMI